MSSKFWYLTSVSLKKKMKTKWFFLINLMLLILIVAILNIESIISLFGGDFKNEKEIIYIDNTNYSKQPLLNNLKITNETLGLNYEYKVTEGNKFDEEIRKNLTDNQILLILNNSTNSYLDAEIITNSYIDTSFYQYLTQTLSTTKFEVGLSLSEIDYDEFNKLTSQININRVILNEEKSTDEVMNTIMTSVFPALILPVFMLVVFLVQMIGNEIFEEKSTRSMEIIISNVSPTTHFFSKILSGNIFVISQGLLLTLYTLIGFFIKNNIAPTTNNQATNLLNQAIDMINNSGLSDKLIYVIPVTLILMILSFITYSLIAGILASMTVNMDDYQQIQTPIMIICVAGYYLSIMAGMFNGSILIRILSYLPLISSLLSPTLFFIGEITIIDILISIIILIITNYFLISKGLKIYKVGILNYSTDKMWKKIFKAVKK